MIEDRGPELFARFAIPPNALTYCGPFEDQALTAALGDSDVSEIRRLAAQFDGAMPYLKLIAADAGLADPLSFPVVAAYWLGTDLLDDVDVSPFGNSMRARFESRAGRRLGLLDAGIEAGRPSHAYHVLCVYPWVGMLRSGHSIEPLHVLEECRIGWGTVTSTNGSQCVVLSPQLVYTEPELHLGPMVERTVAVPPWLAETIEPGDVVAFHWGIVAVRLSARGQSQLERDTLRHLAVVNGSQRDLNKLIERAS